MSSFHVEAFDKTLSTIAPYMRMTVSRMRERFGDSWEQDFEQMLAHVFGSDSDRLTAATKGYVRFALDATRLQKRFEKERRYDPKSYAEASSAVYHNKDYMHTLYLPGILLSHYLWPHHYEQQCYFRRAFAPFVIQSDVKSFYDVGVGTGFYSRLMLSLHDDVHGTAFDISDYALEYSCRQIEAFGFSDRWSAVKRDILADQPTEKRPFLVSVEVLEHLEDPVAFLVGLRDLLKTGGRAFITAAMTAPNEDHIYLYHTADEVAAQLAEAGFDVVECREDAAYEPKSDEPVPRIVAFIVT